MPAEHIVWAPFLGATGDNEDGRHTFVVNLAGDLAVRQHLDLNDVFDIQGPRRLGEGDRRENCYKTHNSQNVLHKVLSVDVEGGSERSQDFGFDWRASRR